MKILIALIYLVFISVFFLAAFSLLKEALRLAPGVRRKNKGVSLQLIGILGLCFILFFIVHGKVIFGIADASRISEVQRIYDRRSWNDEIKIHKGTILDRTGRKENVLAYSEPGEGGHRRLYPLGSAASHLVGYCDLRRKAAGLEAVYNGFLLGKEGKSVFSWSHVIMNKFWRDTYDGQDIVTTIDARLQRTAYEKIKKRKGAVVVIQPATGDVLAIVSSPGFNPEKVKNNADWLALLRRKSDAPLFNRALSGRYPPGSIFKVLTAAAALEAGMDETIYCGPEGFTPSGSRRAVLDFEASRRRNWKGHGSLDLETAMIKSSNTFFANLGTRLGEHNIRRSVHRFNMTELPEWNSRFPLMEYVFVPGRSYFPEAELKPVDLAWTAIGQGEVLITPLDAARIAAAVANNGIMMKLKIEKNIAPEPAGQVISSAVALRLQDILRRVVSEGTGIRANVPGINAAGKTGTAEIGGEEPHSWFIGFAPAKGASIALAVIVENGGLGGRAAAGIAHDILAAAKDGGYFGTAE